MISTEILGWPRLLLFSALLLVYAARPAAAKELSFNECHGEAISIAAGNMTKGWINNETIQQFIYRGPVLRSKRFPQPENFLALTYEGCVELCGTAAELSSDPVSITATWILPVMALLASLPYDSLRKGERHRVIGALSNWLGSPQSAITSIIFNMHQTRKCEIRAARERRTAIHRDSYYVMSCINQYLLPENEESSRTLFRTLAYGLLRPLRTPRSARAPTQTTVAPGSSASSGATASPYSGYMHVTETEQDVVTTRLLLRTLAYQLRVQKKSGTKAAMVSVAGFLVAFALAIAVAFGTLGDNSTAHALALGLLLCWLPMLVALTTVDQNASSADRVRVLIERWLHNVDAIKRNISAPPTAKINWWTMDVPSRLEGKSDDENYRLGEYIGQGRYLWYCGLTFALLNESAAVTKRHDQSCSPEDAVAVLEEVGDRTHANVRHGPKPRCWYVAAGVALTLVWSCNGMGFLISYNTPTAGLGCRSGMYLFYSVFGIVGWLVQFRKYPPRWMRMAAHAGNFCSVGVLTAITMFQITGGLNTCWCKASLLGPLGGYVTFDNGRFIKDNFDVLNIWMAGAVVGAFVPLFVLGFSYRRYFSDCKELWVVEEDKVPEHEQGDDTTMVDYVWLV